MRRLSIVLALVAAATLAASATALARPAADPAPTVFTDPSGDSGAAADLTSVSVTNDTAGTYKFAVGFAGAYEAPSALVIFVDADRNGATGSPSGAEYALGEYEDDQGWELDKWDGTQWSPVADPPSVKVAISKDLKTLNFEIGKDDLGGITSFAFYVVSERTDASTDVDDGPSGQGTWQYKLQQPVTLTTLAATSTPARAGGTWALAVAVQRSDTGDFLGSEGAITCTATVGAKKLPLSARAFVSAGEAKGTAAVCVFKVAKSLRHKVLHATFTVSYEGSSVTRKFTATAK